MLHDESFAIGLAVGKKMGGSGDGVTMSDRLAGLGTLVDIWTIPRYDDPAVENPTRTQRSTWDSYRLRYCCDILDDIYGLSSSLEVNGHGNPYYSLGWSFGGNTATMAIHDAGHDTQWHKAESFLLVSSTAILILYKDGDYNFPLILGGFVQDVQLQGTPNRYDKYAFVEVNSADVSPTWGNLRTPAQVIDAAWRLTRLDTNLPRYHYTHDSLGEGHLAKYFHQLDGYSSDDPPVMEGPYAENKGDVLPSFAALGTIRSGQSVGVCGYMYIGGHSVTWQDDSGETGWHTTSFWIQPMRPADSSQYPSDPHWCGIYPSKLCTYPHNHDDADTSPGTYGDGRADGYEEGYEAGEEAGQASGYQSGYTEGKADGYTEGETAGHTAGYNEGKEDGYQEGYTAGETAGHDEGYQEGYTAGYTAGKADGYQEGYTAGETAGHEAGYSEGYDAGEEAGHDAGYADGYAAGETAGHEAGYTEGYTAGYAAGKADGYSEGYEAGYQAGQQGETPQPPTDGKTHVAVNVGPIDRTMELLLVVHGPAAIEGEMQIMGTLDVDWGDGSDSYQVISPGDTKTLTLTHEYMQAGTYDVIITGTHVTMELGHGGSSNGLVGQSTGSNTAIPISVRSIAIGSGVTAMASYALAHLRGLKSVYIPDGVTLDDYAMRMCYSLEAVRLPSDLVEIPIGCFRDCTSLRSITLPDSITTINNYAFYGCSSLQSITIPAGVVDIGSSAFYGCAALQSFTFPGGVTELPSSCFRGCKSLQSLVLSPNATTIRGYAMYGASALENLEVPATVTRMSDYAVYSAYGLRWMRMLPTTPPSTSQYTFSSIPPGLKFIVPNGSGEAYRTATRWKTYAARIYEESEVNW